MNNLITEERPGFKEIRSLSFMSFIIDNHDRRDSYFRYDKEMKYRRYAIGGLEKLKYKPATPTLIKILLDKSEIDVFRADAFVALTSFDTDETRKIISTFRQQANDTLDKKVIEYADYWTKHN